MTDQPFVRVVGGPYAGMMGRLMFGQAGEWVVYLTCWGRYVTVEQVEPDELRPMSAAAARRRPERVA